MFVCFTWERFQIDGICRICAFLWIWLNGGRSIIEHDSMKRVGDLSKSTVNVYRVCVWSWFIWLDRLEL